MMMKHHPTRHESHAEPAKAPKPLAKKADRSAAHPFWDSVLIPITLAVLGVAALMIAWHSQNVALATATDTRLTLQRSQLVISQWEGKRDQWVIAMNQEFSKTKPDRAWLARTLAEANKATLMWQGYMKLRVDRDSASREQILAQRNHRSEERRVGKEWRSRWSPY